jgi:hypothetical protein
MRRMAFAAATVLLLVPLVAGSGPPTHARESAIHSRRVTASADGGVCRQAGDVTRCRQFVATEYSEPSGRYHETVVRLNQWRNWSNGYGYRDLECVVDRQALKVLPNRALVNAALDVESARCYYNWGIVVTFEPYSEEPWTYAGIVDIDAALLDMRFENRQLTDVRFEDRQTGETHHEACHGASLWEPTGGGFTMLGLYFAFGPEDATGSYYYDSCGITDK